MTKDVPISIYSKLVSRRKQVILVISLITALLVFFNTTCFIEHHTFSESVKALFYPDLVPDNIRILIWNYRIPETMFGLFAGIGLAIAGAEMQTILNNPLAECYTLGISAAAAFGAALVLGYGIGISLLGNYAVMASAFIMSMVSCGIIYYVAKRSASRVTIILVGVALLFLFQALVSLIQSTTTQDSASAIMFWMFGSLTRYNEYSYVAILAVVVMLVALLFAKNMWKLSALKLGDAKVISLGVDVNKLRRNMIVGVSLVSAVCVSFTGTIGFIGLVGPHIARMLVGEDQRYLIPVSAMCGGMLLLLSSLLLKVSPYGGIPIGVVTSIVGVPFFLYLLTKQKGAMSQ